MEHITQQLLQLGFYLFGGFTVLFTQWLAKPKARKPESEIIQEAA